MEYYNNLLNKYQKTGKIGKVKPFNLEHAKKIAWSIVNKSNHKSIPS